MLQKVNFEEGGLQEPDQSQLLRPEYYWELIKRRWLYFLIPFVLIASAGEVLVYLWPATFLSEGKILVQSQQIPTELVRPTVTSAAQERIQVIEQRTMTRDNLLAIIDKFQLFRDKKSLMSDTELVEAMKKRTVIAPVDLKLDFKQKSRAALENPTIVFSIGFEDSNPAIAAKVANELVTRMLSEDLRDRTSRASDTTNFLAREVQKLQAENAALDAKIAAVKAKQLRHESSGAPDQSAAQLSQLKAEYIQKSALYSEKHPVMQAMKRQIEALEKIAAPPAPQAGPDAPVGLDVLEAQQTALQKNLEVATTKLGAARVGETLEKDQQSEKLEVIEQPTVPRDPVKPNRPKLAALVLAAALAAGGVLALLVEMSDKTIRRGGDLFGLVDSQLVVSIPYITTKAELRQATRRKRLIAFGFVVAILATGAITYFILPPIDLLIAKARVGAFAKF